MSTNPPSFRLPFTLPDDVHPAVKDAFRVLFNGLSDHEQAFVALNAKVNALPTTTATSTTTTVTHPAVIGGVNDQSSQTSYQLQQSDYGGLVILNSSLPIAVTTNQGVTKPWFTTLTNNGSGLVTITPDTGTINGAASITLAGGSTIRVFANSADFNWSAA